MTLFSSTQLIKLSQLSTFLGFCQKGNFLKHKKTKVLARNISCDFFVYVKHWPNLPSLVVSWLFYNFKSSKPNELASPIRRKTRKFLVTL